MSSKKSNSNSSVKKSGGRPLPPPKAGVTKNSKRRFGCGGKLK